MPRFAQAAPDRDSRKALEERARTAASPAAPEQKGRWPFPAAPTSPAPASPAAPAEAQPRPPSDFVDRSTVKKSKQRASKAVSRKRLVNVRKCETPQACSAGLSAWPTFAQLRDRLQGSAVAEADSYRFEQSLQ